MLWCAKPTHSSPFFWVRIYPGSRQLAKRPKMSNVPSNTVFTATADWIRSRAERREQSNERRPRKFEISTSAVRAWRRPKGQHFRVFRSFFRLSFSEDHLRTRSDWAGSTLWYIDGKGRGLRRWGIIESSSGDARSRDQWTRCR